MRTRRLLVFWVFLLAWVGAGCMVQEKATETPVLPLSTLPETPLPTNTVKPTITPTPDRKSGYLTSVFITGTAQVIQETALALTPSPTITPSPTMPPSPTVQPTLTPTPLPELVWADWVGMPVRVEDGIVIWSPTENIFLVNDCPPARGVGLLFLAEAPDFDLISITPDEFQCTLASRDVSWNPTGEFFVYTGVPETGFQGEHTDMWIMNRDGSNPRRVYPEGKVGWHMWSDSPWMDDQTFVDATYFGGGNIVVGIMNILTGEVISTAHLRGERFTPNADYLPMRLVGDFDYQILAVLSKKTHQITLPDWLITSSQDRPFPIYSWTLEDLVSSIFEDWLSGTNQMLVFWQRVKNQVEEPPQLALWNVDTDEVTTLAPNGLSGRFSPDGSILAYITLSLPKLDTTARPILNEQWPPTEPQTYLQLIDMESQQVFLSFPTYQRIDEWAFAATHYLPKFAFSPDSRYLTFQTFGTLQFDAAGWPVGVNSDDTLYLHILDLTTWQVIFSSEITTEVSQDPSWSPTSDKLIYCDPQQNLQMFLIEERRLLPIIEDGGELLNQPEWSYDGEYISLCVKGGEPLGCAYTAILHLP
jgi:Tol biopolymer transport system component